MSETTTAISKVPEAIVKARQWQARALAGDLDHEVLDDHLQFQVQQESLAGMALAYDLYLMHCYWNEFPTEWTGQWEYDFWEYGCQRTGKQKGTVQNYRRAGEAFGSGKYEIPEKVQLRGKNGGLILEQDDFGEDPEPIEVPVEPFSIPVSKLVLTTTKVKRGEMTEELWGMLANPQTTWADIHKKLLDEDFNWGSSDRMAWRAYEEGGMILVSENGETYALVDAHGLNWDEYQKGVSAVVKGFRIIFGSLGLSLP